MSNANKFRSRLELHSVIGGVASRQILAAATDVCVRETLNGQYYVTFTYPKLPDDRDRYDALAESNEVHFPRGIENGQHFVIKRADEERRGLRIYKRVEAHHVAFELNRYFLDDYVDFSANRAPAFLLAKIGNGTPYTVATAGSFTNQDVFDFGEARKHDLLNEIRTLYDGELAYDNTKITLTTRKGSNYGAEIRYRKNLTGITRKSHDMERITRLYGYGKNGLTIEGLPGRTVKYIDSPYAVPGHLYEGSVDFPEIDDQNRLLDAMQRHLRTVEIPKVSYDIDFVQLEKVDGGFSAEAIREVGDTVTVIDELLGYRFDARVTDFERYPFEPKRGRVVLANFRELTAGDYVWQATVGSKRAMVYTSENAVLRGIKYDDSITLVDGMGMAVSDEANRVRVRLGQVGPGDYGFAAFNKAGSKTIWLDAATGDGRFSGRLEAASGSFSGEITALSGRIGGWTINANSLSGSGTISGGTITGSTVSGATITGGTIVGTYITTSLSYPRAELSPTGNMVGAYNNASNFATLTSQLPLASAPGLFLSSAGSNGYMYMLGSELQVGTSGPMRIKAGVGQALVFGDIFNQTSINVFNFDKIFNLTGVISLQDALNAKANVFSGVSGTVYVATTPGGPTDRAVTFSNGIRIA